LIKLNCIIGYNVKIDKKWLKQHEIKEKIVGSSKLSTVIYQQKSIRVLKVAELVGSK